NYPDEEYLRKSYGTLCRYFELASGPVEDELFDLDLESIIEFSKPTLKKHKFLNALKILHRSDIIFLSTSVFQPSRLKLSEHRIRLLLANRKNSSRLKEFVSLLLRNYEGIFYGKSKISEAGLSKKFKESEDKIRKALRWLHNNDYGEYHEQFNGFLVGFRGYRYNQKELKINTVKYLQQKEIYIDRLKKMIAYIKTEGCRQKYLSAYFGFEDTDCGICDNCLKNKKGVDITSLRTRIISYLKDKDYDIHELYRLFDLTERGEFIRIVKELESEDYLRIVDNLIQITASGRKLK
ncbi:MAG: RecQ family zinc-binding domain-containing protein, partial [Bacteroidia bacterium]|nr:RecQ family zinc-binding domain-containing protein [Bacteroidia bacterium]